MTKEEVLKQNFGYSGFREGQAEIIDRILDGRDVMAVMPTGAGKSLCYQVPALMLDGITLVISPLISLMQDQVGALIENGVPAAYINSTLTLEQMLQVLNNARAGKYKLLYVAPERLDTQMFYDFCQQVKISLLTVDEAHCISQWGQDFRPSYLKICMFLENQKQRPIVAAFTATATQEVREDIIRILQLQTPFTLTTGFDRKNLYFEVRHPENKYEEVKEYLKTHADQSGIIYCSTRKTVEDVHNRLCDDGFRAGRYHAGLTEEERRQNQDDFVYDKLSVMVATNAFGMGIDKSNVSFVIHYNMPMDMESYYQEAGRAGRDGSDADCILLYAGKDVITNQYLIENGEENPELDPDIVRQVKARSRERLKQMAYYCKTKDCLRAYILRYFGEKIENFCGNCGNCNTHYEEVDITEDAQKILSHIVRMKERYGIKMIVDTLRGSRGERILKLQLNQVKTYGIMHGMPEKRIRDIINYLLLHGYLMQTDTEYPLLKLKAKANPVLRGQERITMKLVKEETPVTSAKTHTEAIQDGLLTKLKVLRTELAREQDVPAYIIFTDATLTDMCRRMPGNEAEFLEVSGVGQAKLDRYGKRFLAVIREYVSDGTKERIFDAVRSKISTLKQDLPLDMFVSLLNQMLGEYGYKSSEESVIQYFVKCGFLEQLSETTFDVTAQGEALGLFAVSDKDKTLLFLDPQTMQFLMQHLENITITI